MKVMAFYSGQQKRDEDNIFRPVECNRLSFELPHVNCHLCFSSIF